jgi:hypothetical protein
MTHLTPQTRALYAGKDLGAFANWRAQRHLAVCAECRREVEAFAALSESLADLNAVPALPWNRLAAEMRANIHLGLEAGECVRSEPATLPLAWLAGPRAMIGCASAVALLAAGLYLQRPVPSPPQPGSGQAVLRVTPSGIELNQGGQSFTLMHGRAQDAVTYSAGAQGSLIARYVDNETGNVTINNVYVQ